MKVEESNGYRGHPPLEGSDARPSPTLQAGRALNVFDDDQGLANQARPGRRPPYAAVLAAAWLEHLAPRGDAAPTVASLFAGCGGSSLGYRMAGFREVLAVEWDANAAESFRANFPSVPLWQGDVAELTDQVALEMAGLQPGELDVLDGSPPCQGFSTAGRRILDDPRNALFREHVRLLRAFRPRALVLENVSGMVKGKMKLAFAEIIRELKACGYRVQCRLLDAQWFDVPQARQRVIFIGVREDLELEPRHARPAPRTRYWALREVLPSLMSARTFRIQENNGYRGHPFREAADGPAPAQLKDGPHRVETDAVVVNPTIGGYHVHDADGPSPALNAASAPYLLNRSRGGFNVPDQDGPAPSLTTAPPYVAEGTPPPRILDGGRHSGQRPFGRMEDGEPGSGVDRPAPSLRGQRRLDLEQPQLLAHNGERRAEVPQDLDRPSRTLQADSARGGRQPELVLADDWPRKTRDVDRPPPTLRANAGMWLQDQAPEPPNPGVASDWDVGEQNADYLTASRWGFFSSPTDGPARALPAGHHQPQVLITEPAPPPLDDRYGELYDQVPEGGNAHHVLGGRNAKQNTVKPRADRPGLTLSHTQLGHGFATMVHPTVRRALTIAEAKIIGSFPDDFVLIGNYQQRWARIGNSVPPLLMRAIARDLAALLRRETPPADDLHDRARQLVEASSGE